MVSSDIIISVPAWLAEAEAQRQGAYLTAAARMSLAIELAERSTAEGTGGPFGAAIFDLATHRLVAAGVNLVTSANCSLAHAEMVAIARAQQRMKTWNLAAKGRFELATSCAPCAMCLGAIPWSGVCSVVCGARDEHARAIGFDEGAKPADWAGELEKRGITVTQDILIEKAAAVLRAYAAKGGTIY